MWIVFIVVAVGQAHAPESTAMLRAAREALDGAADVRLAERDTSSRTSLIERQAEVVVEWDESQTIARLIWRDVRRNVSRSVSFTAADLPAERGRTLGFVLASMLPERAPGDARVPRQPPETTPPSGQSGQARSRDVVPPASHGADQWNGAVEAVGTFAVGLGEQTQLAFGGGLSGLWFPSRRWSLRVELEARTGQIADAQASALWTSLTVGAGWSFFQLRGRAMLDLGLHVDAGVARQSFTHFSGDDTGPVAQVVWLPVVETMLELRVHATPALAIVGAGGVEVAFTTTDIFVHGQLRATVAPIHAVVTLGISVGI